jgi:hypothetical protein
MQAFGCIRRKTFGKLGFNWFRFGQAALKVSRLVFFSSNCLFKSRVRWLPQGLQVGKLMPSQIRIAILRAHIFFRSVIRSVPLCIGHQVHQDFRKMFFDRSSTSK